MRKTSYFGESVAHTRRRWWRVDDPGNSGVLLRPFFMPLRIADCSEFEQLFHGRREDDDSRKVNFRDSASVAASTLHTRVMAGVMAELCRF